MKRLSIYMLAAGMAALSTSCSDFLDTVPKDQLAPSTTWQTEADAKGFIVGCYKEFARWKYVALSGLWLRYRL